ncbi:MAG: WG repeat-containing protein [Saprospiraceae bacterium]|nr:WG repeat-containing protein [Saprospiraceae bacterium]
MYIYHEFIKYGLCTCLVFLLINCNVAAQLQPEVKIQLKDKYTIIGKSTSSICAVAISSQNQLLWGFVDMNGKEVYHPMFRNIVFTRDQSIIVETNQGKGLIDEQGVELLHPNYDDIQVYWDFVYILTQGKSKKVYTQKDGMVLTTSDGFFTASEKEQLLWFSQNQQNTCYVLSRNQKYMHKQAFAKAKRLNSGAVAVADANDNWGILSEKGDTLVKIHHDTVETHILSKAALLSSGIHQYIFSAAQDLIYVPMGVEAHFAEDGSLYTTVNGEIALVDAQTGHFYTIFQYDSLQTFYKLDYHWVLDDGEAYFIDTKGKEMNVPRHHSMKRKGLFWEIEQSAKKGLWDKDLKQIIPMEYEEIQKGERNFLLKKEGQYFLCDQKGNFVNTNAYDRIQTIPNTPVLIAEQNRKYGVLAYNGREILRPSCDSVQVFGKRLWLKKEGKWRLYSLKGKQISTLEFDFIQDFYCLGIYKILVQHKGKYGIIDEMSTSLLLPTMYDEIDMDCDGKKIRVREGEKWFYVNNLNEQVDD